MKQPRSHCWKSRAAAVGRQLIGAAGLLAAVALPPAAFAEEPYFDGQTIDFLSGASAGNEGNALYQEWANALERLHPNTRVIIHSNSGGSSALNAALLADAKPDGLTVGTSDMDSMLARATGDEIKDITQFAILGSLNRRRESLFASTSSGIKSLDDLKAASAVMAVRSTQSNDYFLALFLNASFDIRIKPVTGYSSAERELAFQSGENQLMIFSKQEAEKALADGIGVPLLALTDAPLDGDLANVPTLASLRGNARFAWVKDLILSFGYSRIFATQKDVPADRLETLRETFMAIVQEPEFVAAATPLTTLIATDGKTMEERVKSTGAQDPAFATKVKEALECGKRAADTGEKCGSGT
jgi:tripartite-type tricarboxylate transporter receptor subunit TctC